MQIKHKNLFKIPSSKNVYFQKNPENTYDFGSNTLKPK